MAKRYGIVKWRWGQVLQRASDPATVQLTDSPNPKPNATKGTPIPLLAWKNLVRKFNTAKAAGWLLIPQTMWVNREDEKCEPITCSGNFIEIIGENSRWYRIPAQLNTAKTHKGDWFHNPTMYFKATARKLWTGIYNVGKGLDVYVPHLVSSKAPYAWIKKSDVELLPSLPFTLEDDTVIVDYVLEGASVIGVTSTGIRIYLRKATKPGECIQETSWKLATPGVIPPAV